MKGPVVAVVGATGLVGQEMLEVIGELNLPFSELRLLASESSAGEVYQIPGGEAVVEVLDEGSFEGVDIALFATSAELSKKFVPLAIEAGAVAIDNSSCFRMQQDVPLVIPEVNAGVLNGETKLIANPNCSTIQLVPVLKAIDEIAGLKRVVVSTYQAVSGAGKDALDELWSQCLAIFNQKELPMEVFGEQIAFNCIPRIDVITEDGYTKEEKKIIEESRKILDLPELAITATAVRVPVFHCHAESVNVETQNPISPSQLVEVLSSRDGIRVYPNSEDFPMQIHAAKDNDVHVGRIRKDFSVPNGLNLWVVSDNLRKGAAFNAVQIAKCLCVE